MYLALIVVLSIFSLLLLIGGWRWLIQYRELVQLRERLTLKDQELKKRDEQIQIFKNEISSSFSMAAQEALKSSNQELMKVAELSFQKHQQEAVHQLEKKNLQIGNLVDPLKESLKLFHKEINSMEKERQRSYATVESEIKKVIDSSLALSQETRALKDALKKPHVRGRWGEIQLKNCVELAGMSEYADLSFQNVNEQDGKKLIPDLVVRMPGGRQVVVDAKTPLDAFLSSLEAKDENTRRVEMERHGRQVKEHIRKLGLKSYGEVIEGSADFTVMFLPNESFLYAALETQADIVEYAMDKQILVATPPTFVGLLKVVRFGWNEQKLAENAQEISNLGRELHKRVADFTEAYLDIGKSLKTAQDRYDLGLKRLNSRVLVQAKKMETLGAKSHKDLPLDH